MNISYNFYVKKIFYACYVKNVVLPIDMIRNEKINGLLPTCTCGENNEIEWVQQCFSNRTGLFKIYSKFEEKQMYHVFLNKFEYF
ncbi:hypothetical protein [Spiroplasma ixodetis]|uniref:hypothetical protein n=1 Tax=Spiroplasma ixodetis TaxID=2141 RepID=UPI002576CB50|nr:hypothetical protein [Spiroplasma ixodetis]